MKGSLGGVGWVARCVESLDGGVSLSFPAGCAFCCQVYTVAATLDGHLTTEGTYRQWPNVKLFLICFYSVLPPSWL
jgi:hypothetical protein